MWRKLNNKKVFENYKKLNFFSVIIIPIQSAFLPVLLYVLMEVILVAVPLLQIQIAADFINIAANIGGERSKVFQQLFYLISIIIIKEIAVCIDTFSLKSIHIKLNQILMTEILEKIAVLKFSYIEDTSSQTLISRIKKDATNKFVNGFSDVCAIVNLILRILGIALIIMNISLLSGITLLISLIPLGVIAKRSGKSNYEAEKQVSENFRYVDSIDEILTAREFTDERYVFSFTNELKNRWLTKYIFSSNHKLNVEKQWFVKMKLTGVLVSFISVFIIISLIPSVASGTLTIGLFISLINFILSLMQEATWNLTGLIDSLTQVSEFVKDLKEFITFEEVNLDQEYIKLEYPFKFKKLSFKEVFFSYPGISEAVLKGISFEIEEGKHYAFVGSNGEGKSTIIKLLLGLYENYFGEILINDINIKNISPQDRRNIFSVVFQDFSKYNISIRDNIQLGAGTKILKSEEINTIIDKCGLLEKTQCLKHGVDTKLGKFNESEVEFSGGEWQKLAIGRSIANDSDVYILDEPTASLDPISESQLYKQFINMSSERTSILISHRLSSTTLVDIIFVLENGKIKEQGGHKELMDKGGLYYRMFEEQRKWYGEEKLI